MSAARTLGHGLWRGLRATLLGVLGLVVMVLALAGGLLLHLGIPPARRMVATQLPGLLEGAFPGKVVVHELGALSLGGVGRVDVDLLHPDGERVAALRNVDVELGTWRTVKSLFGQGPMEIPIEAIAVDAVDLDVTSRDGSFRIVEVFVDPDAPVEPEDPAAKGLDLHIDRLEIDHLWAHGSIDGQLHVDADVDAVRASLVTDPEATSVGLERATVRTRGLPRGADLHVDVHAAFTTREAATDEQPMMSALAAIGGTVGGTPISVLGLMWGDAVHGMITLPAVRPDHLRGLAPEAPPFAATASLGAVVDGTVDHLAGHALLLADATRIGLDADVLLAPTVKAKAHLVATSLDASLVGGPRSALSLTADATIAVPEGGEPSGEVTLRTERGRVDAIVVPPIEASATFRGESARGKADIHEPGVLTHVAFEVTPGARGQVIDATLAAPRVELAQLHARGVQASGKLTVDARARVDLGAETVVASATVTGGDLSSPLAPDVSVKSVELDARAQGALASPDVHVSLLARQVLVAGQRIDTAMVQATGPAMHPMITATVEAVDVPRIRARTRLHLEPTLALEDVWVEATRGTTTARARVDRIDLGGGGMPTVRGATVDGLGDTLTVSLAPEAGGATRFVARAPRLSIPALSQLAAIQTGVSRGMLAIDADLAVGRGQIDGDLVVEVEGVDARPPVPGAPGQRLMGGDAGQPPPGSGGQGRPSQRAAGQETWRQGTPPAPSVDGPTTQGSATQPRHGIRVEGLDGRVDATFEGRTVTFDLSMGTARLGRVEVTSRRPLVLAGPPEDPRSWKEATGQIAFDANLDLATASLLIPPGMMPVADVTGRLVAVGHVDRDRKGRAPEVHLSARTDGLALVGKATAPPAGARVKKPLVDPNPPNAALTAGAERVEGKTDAAMGPAKDRITERKTSDAERPDLDRLDPSPAPAWTLRGVDFTVNARAEPEPQAIAVSASATDVHGPLVTLTFDSPITYGRLLRDGLADRRWLEETPVKLHVAIPSREIADLPRTLGLPAGKGRVVADLRVDGTARKPRVELDAALAHLSLEKSRLEEPFTTKLLATYDGAKAVAHLAIDQSDRRLLQARVDGQIAMADLLRPASATAARPLPWTASADVELGPLPLEILQAITPAPMEGMAHGRIQLDGLHRDASLLADLQVDGLVLGGIPHEVAKLRVTARNGQLDGSLRLAQPKGWIAADARVGIAWGARLAPELQAQRKFDVDLKADNFRIRAAEPFVSSTFNQLDGRLDGSVKISEAAILKALQSGGVQGKLALTRGTVELVAAGGRLEDVRATVRLDDRGIVRLEDVFARGQTGEVRAVGLATFGGGGLQAAKLNVLVPERRPMPLLIGGEHLGDLSGDIRAAAGWADQGRELRVKVEIPRLVVALPDRLPDGVQKLDEIARARVGTVRNGRFVALPLDAPDPVEEVTPSSFRTRLDILLEEATITQGDMLRTRVHGNPTLFLQDGQTRMAGTIEFEGGDVDIKGRLFEIEHGTITFGEDPANPDVILTASWEAPDGTKVFADFAGPLQTGKVTLRSNPPRSREEILALVVFGRIEGMQPGGDSADTSTQAIGTAGGFATQGLNAALADMTSLEIRTRVDTSSSTNPRPELEVQISRAIAVRIAYLLGEIGPGQSADKTFATVDWNFQPQWSLETTVGDKASTTVDMIWEHLY